MTDARVARVAEKALVVPSPASRVARVAERVLARPSPSTTVARVAIKVLVAATPAYSTTASLSGSGALSASLGPLAVTGTAALGGSGALSAAVSPGAVGSASLGGSGILAAATTPRAAASASLAGSGSMTTFEGLMDSAVLGGAGSLAVVTTPAVALGAGLGGSGSLQVVAAPTFAAPEALAGSGSLSVVVSPPAFSASAGLGGSGTLSVPSIALASLSGSGALAILSAVPRVVQTVDFASSSTESLGEVTSESITTGGGGGGGGGGVVGELKVVVLDTTIERAPSSITIMVSGGRPEEPITFQMDAGLTPSGQSDIYTTNLDTEGSLNATSLTVTDVLGGQQGTRTLTATQGGVTATATYTVLKVPTIWPSTQGPDAQAIEIPEALDPETGVRHWVLQDLLGVMDGGIGSYVLPSNPRTMSSPHLEHAIKSKHTTAHSGKFHLFQAGNIPKSWTFSGYTASQEMLDALKAYRALNRRFYLIDHHNRAWKVVFDNVDIVPRLRHVYNGEITDWGSDYTVTATIVDQNWVTPA